LGRFEEIHKIKNKVDDEAKESTPTSFINKIKQWFIEDEGGNPSSWPGENGKAVSLSGAKKDESKKRFKENQFNIVASDMIALNRSLPDQRSSK